MHHRTVIAITAPLLALAGCRGHHFEPPDRQEQVAQADSAYSPALFDSIHWPSDSLRLFVGNNTYAAQCRKCHGYLGKGDTDYDRAHGIQAPSLVRPDWQYASDIQAVRHIMFTGHAGMPTWGVAGITPREIDATAYYVLSRLRPDVLGADSTP
ncbi:MAG TPA: cytochrome c [Longimicrobiales bacterium]|nr:cytochrome c [Longimicrobiales bacterium]